MRQRSARGFGATGIKYALAALFMGGALGMLVWRVVARAGPEDGSRPERAVAVSPEGAPVETNYTPVRTTDDAREAVARLGEGVTQGAARTDAVRSLGAPAAAGVGAAATDALGSFFTGSYADFVEAMARLGAKIDPEAERSPLFDRFAAWCAMGEPDLDRLEVRPFEAMAGPEGARAEAQPRRVSRTAAPAGERGDEGPGVGVRQMMISTESMFPEADVRGEHARQPIEVRVPVRPKSGVNKGGEVTLGVVLVWNEGLGLWQPGAFSQTMYSLREDD